MTRNISIVALVLALAVAACGGSDTASDPTNPPTTAGPGPGQPIDGAWVLTAAMIDGAELELLPDWQVTMLIEGIQIGGRAACNSYGGKVSSDGRVFGVGEIAMTEMGCEPQIHVIESAFLDALLRANAVDRRGEDLTLRGDGVELEFALVPPVEPAALVGTTWILDTLIDGEAASSVDARADEAILVFNEDGTFSGSTGCRALSGEYVVDGAFVQFPSFGAEGDCPAELQRQDSQVITVLESFKVEIDGTRLTLTAPGGEGLSYRAEG